MQDRLTFFLDNGGHGFIGLECDFCADGKPAEFKAGFYPGIETPQCDNDIKNPDDHNQALLDKENKLRKVMVPVLKSQAAQFSQRPTFSIVGTTIFRVVNPQKKYSILNEGAIDGKSMCNSTASGIKFVKYSGYFKETLDGFYRVSYEISSEDSIRIYNRVKYLAENDDLNYRYELIGYNCLDFAREIYQLTSLENKSFTSLYNLNPLPSLAGLNGASGSYIVARDAYEMTGSNPALALVAGYAAYKLYKWASNKISRSFGSKFNPESISTEQRTNQLTSIRTARKALLKSIRLLEEPLNQARDLMNDCYGATSRKDEYPKLRANYTSIRDNVQICEQTLAVIDQLGENYESLFKEYCSKGYAHTIISMIQKTLSYSQDVEKQVLEFVRTLSGEKQDNEPDDRMAIKF